MLSCDLTLNDFIRGLAVRHSRSTGNVYKRFEQPSCCGEGRAGFQRQGRPGVPAPLQRWFCAAELRPAGSPQSSIPCWNTQTSCWEVKMRSGLGFRILTGIGPRSPQPGLWGGNPAPPPPVQLENSSLQVFCQSFCFLLQCLPCVTSVHYTLL